MMRERGEKERDSVFVFSVDHRDAFAVAKDMLLLVFMCGIVCGCIVM